VAAQDAGAALFEQLAKGFAPGGGMSWRKSKRDFVNAAATAPAAIAYARAGDPHTAAALIDWMNATLWDAERSLYMDGVNVRGEEYELERGEYTYNQGTALGALLTLAASGVPCEVDPIERAERLIVGIVKHMTEEIEFVSGARRRILISHGDGDGGLFTGILVRYLGMAASSPLLSDEARALASSLIYSTARALWEGRREFDPNLPMNELGIDPNEIRGRALVQFSPRFTQATSEALKPGVPVEFSTQLQAWIILETAARLAHARDIASHRGY
jgi:predicted glycosyl hydrolase